MNLVESYVVVYDSVDRLYMWCLFFFQAEDGIRDAQESRGLGDVYKRQVMNGIPFYLREIFTYQIPIVIPALGLLVGGLYGMVFLVTVLVKLFLVIHLGRIFLEERSYGSFEIPAIKSGNLGSASIKALRGQTRIFSKIALTYFLMTLLVFYLTDEGFFQAFDVIPLAALF